MNTIESMHVLRIIMIQLLSLIIMLLFRSGDRFGGD